MKVMDSAVTREAAQMRSPSFSRSSSSATMTSLPAAKSAIACSTVENGMEVNECVRNATAASRSPRGRVRGNELADVLPDHVRLDVHAVAGTECTERGVRPRVLDERYLKNPRSGERVHGEAHSVDRDGAVRDHQRLEVLGQADVDEQRVGAPLDALHRADAVDMALHHVSAEAVAEAERALEVHPPAGFPRADGGAIEGRDDRRDGEPASAVLAHGEAGAVHRDALARGEPDVPRRNAQLAPRLRPLHTLDHTDIVNQPGEH